MMKLTATLVVLWVLASPAAAQPVQAGDDTDDPSPLVALSPSPGAARAPSRADCTGARLSRRCKDWLLRNPEYRAARRERIAGVLVAAIGGGAGGFMVGLSVAAMGLVALSGLCTDSECDYEPGERERDFKIWGGVAIGSAVLMVASLAVGIPMASRGKSEADEIKRLLLPGSSMLPTPTIAIAPGHAFVGGQWRF